MKLKNFLDHTFVGDRITSSSVIVDLGAFTGEFSEYMADNYKCRIYAVEPLPDFFNKIRIDEFIKKFQYCIAPQKGSVTLYYPSDLCPTLYGSDRQQRRPSLTVRGGALEDFLIENDLKHIDLLKVDIEGAEIAMFESLKKETLDKIDQITVEFHDFVWPELYPKVESIKKNLERNGYYCIAFSLLNNGDVLFIKQTLISKIQYIYLKYIIRYLFGAVRLSKKILHKYAQWILKKGKK